MPNIDNRFSEYFYAYQGFDLLESNQMYTTALPGHVVNKNALKHALGKHRKTQRGTMESPWREE
jgi:hypothetical protein